MDEPIKLLTENNMTQVELKQAKDRFMELNELAASGEEVIIARDKEPLVRLTSMEKQNGRVSLAVQRD